MKLVFANDGGRLGRQPSLIQLKSVLVHELSAEHEGDFIKQFKVLGDDVVLFWHERAEPALKLLSRLVSDGRWPTNLLGVVMFSAGAFAGIGSKEAAKNLVYRYRLSPSTVHMFPLIVSDKPRPETVECILRFGLTVLDHRPVVLPYWMLAPRDEKAGVFTVLVLDLLIRNNADTVARGLDCVDWTRVSQDCTLYKIAVPRLASTEAIQTMAHDIRKGGNYLDRFPYCRDCGLRSVLEHNKLKNLPKDETIRVSALKQLCGEAAALAGSASSLVEDAAKEVASRLTMTNAESMLPLLQFLLTASYSRECKLFGARDTLPATVSAVEAALLANGYSDVLVKGLRQALECAGDGGISL